MRALTTVDRVLVHGLLGPSRLATRVRELESDRGVVVDTAAADLRRIERDLHDGAQARLVALAMDLGLAKEKLDEDPAGSRPHGRRGARRSEDSPCRSCATSPAASTPPSSPTAAWPPPSPRSPPAAPSRCTVDVDLPQRPAPAIEGIAYFTVSELLQNISKHSAGHATADVDVWRAEDRLMLQVGDDGRGGADASAGGSGLAGLAERLDAVDGVLVVDSPAGGPTPVTAELPWR